MRESFSTRVLNFSKSKMPFWKTIVFFLHSIAQWRRLLSIFSKWGWKAKKKNEEIFFFALGVRFEDWVTGLVQAMNVCHPFPLPIYHHYEQSNHPRVARNKWFSRNAWSALHLAHSCIVHSIHFFFAYLIIFFLFASTDMDDLVIRKQKHWI